MPINLGQHAIDLDKDEQEEELQMQKKWERIYNVSGDAANFDLSLTELYGFIVWMISALLCILLTIWAWAPSEVLKEMGLIYLPDRYYIIAVTHWVILTFLFYVLGQDALSMIKSHPRNSYFTM